ncbi:SIMPL domain-containing protein [Chloroflexota bacterium]
MRRRQLPVICLLLVAVIIGAAGCDSFSPPSSSKATTGGVILSQQSTGIWVTGEGTVTVVPDVAILSLGVESQAATVAEARQHAATAMDSVARELDNYGIAQKDIKTQHFSIYPVRRWVPEKEEEILIGYRVTNTVTAKVRKVEDTGNVIDAVAIAGGDYIRINSISFTVDDPYAHNKEAREKAMADAREKAKQLADLGGVKLDDPTYINESSGAVPIVRAATFEGASAPTVSTSISPGETEIRLTVQVVYGIE